MTLDEIRARHDLLDASYKGACSCCKPPQAHVDRAALLAALRAVEALCAYWGTMADGDRYYVDNIRERIREALG